MKLLFEGQAIVEQGFDGVKFVGRYVDPQGRDGYVICRVDRDALTARCGLSHATADDLLAAYQSISTEINHLASVQYSGGVERPLVTVQDLTRLNQQGSAAA